LQQSASRPDPIKRRREVLAFYLSKSIFLTRVIARSWRAMARVFTDGAEFRRETRETRDESHESAT
jgi:hypothetical protein